MDADFPDTDQAAAAEAGAAAAPDVGVVETPPSDDAPIDVETLVATLEAVTAERDSHLADLQRLTAEFANFRRQATRRQTETIEHAASGLAEKLLPVLDACEAAVAHGATDVEPIHGTLVDALRKEGLERIAAIGEPFDPELHEAVMHVDGGGGPVVADVMRSGYVWNGRVLRPAMVKVEG
jgi:molecular chaperone GrpE